MAQVAYKKVYEALRERIADKTYDVGAFLPPEPELEKQFGVSRTTVRRAIGLLVQEGFLSVKQGSGTSVISRKATQSFNRFTSISETLAQKGHKIGLKSSYTERVKADERLATLLDVAVGTPLICVHRIKTADGKSVCIMRNYILEELVPDLDVEQEIPLLYDFLYERYGISYNGSKDLISACNASFEQAQLLDIKPRDALVCICRTCYMGNRPCEVDMVDIVADIYQCEVFIGEKST